MRSESTSAFGQPRETKPTLGLLVAFALVALLTRGETGEGKSGEHVARLALHLLLELAEHLLALLHVGLHQALHGRALQIHELRPELLASARVIAVHLLRLVLQRGLDVLERPDVALEVGAHHALHGAAVGADELREQIWREERHAAG